MSRTHSALAKAYLGPRLQISFLGASLVIAALLTIASWTFILGFERELSRPFFSIETLRRAWSFVGELVGTSSSSPPAFSQLSEWHRAGKLAYQTLVMSVLGIGFAGVVALATFTFGAQNVMMGELAPYGRWAWKALFFAVRSAFILTRGIPELVWAMLLIFVFSPGILPGAIALGIHNAGILGKLAAEVVEGLDLRPMRALRSSGAGSLQIIAYGVLPQALPRFMTYLFYRWEVIIRTTIIVGFVAAGGLGTDFRLSMSHFQYTSVTLLLIWYFTLVIGVDMAASVLRRLAR